MRILGCALVALACGCGNDTTPTDLGVGSDLSGVADDMGASGDLAVTGTWTRLFPPNDPGGPQPRGGFATAWDGAHVLLSAGQVVVGGSSLLNDLWSYDPATNAWTQLTPNGTASAPPGRIGHGIAWTGARLLLYGGSSNHTLSDVWSWTAAGGWVQELADGQAGSPARTGFEMVWDGAELLVHGGVPSPDGSIAAYDPVAKQWSTAIAANVTPTPGVRVGSGFAVRPLASGGSDGGALGGTEVLLFGGATNASFPLGSSTNDLWTATASGWTMKIFEGANGSPSDRYDALVLWDGAEYLLIGGIGQMSLSNGQGAVPQNDVWAYSPATGRWTERLATKTSGAPPLPKSEFGTDALAGYRGVWTGSAVLIVAEDSSVWKYAP